MQTYLKPYAALMRLVKPSFVLEWGPGQNSQIALDAGAAVVAIEHDRQWVPHSDNKNFTCIVPSVDGRRYVDTWGTQDANVAFIDGRRRAECLELCCHELPDSVIVCLHDAQRMRYHDALGKFENVRFLNQGFAIASNDAKVILIADQIRMEA